MAHNNKKIKVSGIKQGTVIDHIPASALLKIIKILQLENIETPFTFCNNLNSAKLEKKALIKIANKFLIDNEIDKIALIAPLAKINIIEDYKVIEKRTIKTPSTIVGMVKCVNPNCITNQEIITPRFKVTSEKELECHYCQKITGKENIEYL